MTEIKSVKAGDNNALTIKTGIYVNTTFYVSTH